VLEYLEASMGDWLVGNFAVFGITGMMAAWFVVML
jgi:hypothetical protein